MPSTLTDDLQFYSLEMSLSNILMIGFCSNKARRPYPNCHAERHLDVFLITHPPTPHNVERGNTK